LAEDTDDLVEDLTARVQKPCALVFGPGTVFTDDDHAVDVQFAATSTERSSNRVEQGDIVFGGHPNANVWPPDHTVRCDLHEMHGDRIASRRVHVIAKIETLEEVVDDRHPMAAVAIRDGQKCKALSSRSAPCGGGKGEVRWNKESPASAWIRKFD